MLLRLSLKDFVIVDQLEIEFASGFSALTGETGAGKSILLDALGLALGERADGDFVRNGALKADIVAEFEVSSDIHAWLSSLDLGGEDKLLQTVLLRRVIDQEGKSRAYINGAPVTIAQLKQTGEQLLEIHGQHAAQALLKATGQRQLLDAYSALTSAKGDDSKHNAQSLKELFKAWRQLQQWLKDAQENSKELELQRDALAWQVSELQELSPKAEEWQSLNEEQQRLSHAKELIQGAQSASAALAQADDSLTDRLGQVSQSLSHLVQLDARLNEALELIKSAHIQLDEAADQLTRYADRLDLDPDRLQLVDARVAALFSLSRKLKIAPEALADALVEKKQKLEALQASQDIDKLQVQVANAQSAYLACAKVLSKARHKAASKLSQTVSALLPSLGMKSALFEVALLEQPPSESGIDAVEFRFAGHAGVTPKALAKVASGGELSRVSLAISVLAAQANPVGTLIFDEADAGVGGGVASVIGKLMRQLGQDRQVLCVTHLPQVAALAHQHYLVSKNSDSKGTQSQVEQLSKQARVDEIARMLGAEDITANTRKLARELIAAE